MVAGESILRSNGDVPSGNDRVACLPGGSHVTVLGMALRWRNTVNGRSPRIGIGQIAPRPQGLAGLRGRGSRGSRSRGGAHRGTAGRRAGASGVWVERRGHDHADEGKGVVRRRPSGAGRGRSSRGRAPDAKTSRLPCEACPASRTARLRSESPWWRGGRVVTQRVGAGVCDERRDREGVEPHTAV